MPESTIYFINQGYGCSHFVKKTIMIIYSKFTLNPEIITDINVQVYRKHHNNAII